MMPGVILRYRNLGAGTARGRMYSAEAAAVNARAAMPHSQPRAPSSAARFPDAQAFTGAAQSMRQNGRRPFN
jgi:hypothetical protein